LNFFENFIRNHFLFEFSDLNDEDMDDNGPRKKKNTQKMIACEDETLSALIYTCLESLVVASSDNARPHVVSHIFKLVIPVSLMSYTESIPQNLSKVTHHKARSFAVDFLFRISVVRFPDSGYGEEVNQVDNVKV